MPQKFLNVSNHRRDFLIDIFLALIFAASVSKRFGSSIHFIRPTYRTAEWGGRRGHCPGARGHRGTRGSELSGLECKIHQLKLRPAGAMMLFFDFGPKFEHPRTL